MYVVGVFRTFSRGNIHLVAIGAMPHILRSSGRDTRGCGRESKKEKEFISGSNRLRLLMGLFLSLVESLRPHHACLLWRILTCGGVAGALGTIGAHVIIDAFGSPWSAIQNGQGNQARSSPYKLGMAFRYSFPQRKSIS